MTERDLQQAFERCLSDPLGRLVGSHGPGAVAPPAVGAWNLPSADIDALRAWGVPIFRETGRSPIQLVGAIQSDELPSMMARGYSAYGIGRYWRREIGALEHSGTVIGVPYETTDDATSDATSDLSFLNSSVKAFLEIAWRWGAAREVLLAFDDYERLYENLGRFQDLVHRLDPMVGSTAEYAWWDGIVEGW
ncbi:hypothetical protein ABH920_001986 [Catenulispora sp. EB89]|uniref:SUKH-4 family immunity protein n=1 Tax=Catenulispora sp. EB89 TaxID=3156257 RepID=UPI003511A4A1